jgi:hypothetical protein
MATDTENMKDIEYIDEDLDDIEYTEILTFEEMSKINPSFIALDKEEIYNHLYIFFKDKKKSDLLRSLFYEILSNRDSKNGKISDYTNYIFNVDGELEKYGDDNSKEATYNFIEKYNKDTGFSEFVKRRFCISYDRKSDLLRLKPIHNTNTIINGNGEAFPKYHSIVKDYNTIKCSQIEKVEDIYNINDGDDISLPISGSYYKIPTSTRDDYLYAKIASHLLNSINTNYKSSDDYKDIHELIKNTRPDLSSIIKEINNSKDSFYLDYSNINNIFKKYDYSLDFITDKDLEVLTDYMFTIIKNEKERKNTHKVFKIKRPVLINRKLTFFDNIDKILKIINISPQIEAFLEKTKELILNYKNDIIQANVEPLKNYNVYDIIKQINEGTITIEEVIEELKLSIKSINIDNALDAINDILEAKENIEAIKGDCYNKREQFIHSRTHIFDYDTDGKHFIISKRENKAIRDGNDIDDYEGTHDDDDIIDDENKGVANNGVANAANAANAGNALGNKVVNNYDMSAYISNIHFRNEKGFIDILKIILEIIKKINDVANIDINYDALSNYLFKKYRSASTRYDKYLKEFENKNIEDAKKYAKKYAEMTPGHLLNMLNNRQIEKVHIDIIKKVNDKFIDNINVIFYNSICFWIVDTQDNINKNNITLNMNYLNPSHIDKLNTRGLLYYIIEIISDFYKYNDSNDSNDYIINIKGLKKTLVSIIEEEYKDADKKILDELLNKNTADKINKCSIDKLKYSDEELYYIDKLLYTPNNNSKFEKIHKYIQGCCLRKLDNNFNDISDFETTNNTEIIKLKKLYSDVRLSNAERDVRFVPTKQAIKKKRNKKGKKARSRSSSRSNSGSSSASEDEADTDADYTDIYLDEIKRQYDNIKYFAKKPDVYNISNYEVNEWLEGMQGITELLPNYLIDNIINYELDPVETAITDNIKKLKKVKNNISSDFLNCKYINYKEILLNICKILYSNFNASQIYKDNKTLKTKVMAAIKEIRKVIKHLYKLNKIKNEENTDVINTINILIISRSLNYPYLDGIENIPSEFINNKADEIYEYLKNYVEGKYNKFLTPEEIAIFINEKREEYKIKKLKENQNLDIEENEIRRQVKAAGIIKDNYNVNVDDGGSDDGGDGGGGAAAGNRASNDIDDYDDAEKDADYDPTNNVNHNNYDDDDIDID